MYRHKRIIRLISNEIKVGPRGMWGQWKGMEIPLAKKRHALKSGMTETIADSLNEEVFVVLKVDVIIAFTAAKRPSAAEYWTRKPDTYIWFDKKDCKEL